VKKLGAGQFGEVWMGKFIPLERAFISPESVISESFRKIVDISLV